MAYSTMIVNKARGKKGSRGKVRVRGRKKTRNCTAGCATPRRNPRKPTALSEATEFIHTAQGYMCKAKREKYQGMAQAALDAAERYLVMAKSELDRTAHPASERLEEDADAYLDDVRAMKVALAKGGIRAIRNPVQRKRKAAKKKATKKKAKKKVIKRRVTTTTTVTKRVVAERNSAALRNFYNLRQDLD